MKTAWLVLGMFLPVFLSSIGGYGLRYNGSESLPHSLYVSSLVKPSDFVLGQFVAFKMPQGTAMFAKKIAGVPGDLIEVKEKVVYVNGQEQATVLEKYASIEGGIIPDGHYFMLGEHVKSFDSRYFEFGLVPQELIREKLCPIF